MAAVIKGTDGQTLAISTGSAEFAAALKVGVKYLLSANVDCFFRTGATSGTATTSDAPLYAKTYLEITVDNSTDAYIQVITASGSGTAYLTPLSRA